MWQMQSMDTKKKVKWQKQNNQNSSQNMLTAETVGGSQFCLQMEL
jgi:hypothetical protein